MVQPTPASITAVESLPPTRQAGLTRLQQFLPRVPAYSGARNSDDGRHAQVSRLSAYLTHRLILEAEVINQTRARHGADRGEKFIQEVCWRTYWKGWLELRPQVWRQYRDDLATARESLTDNESETYYRAITGTTGIECFDHWVGELTAANYLHNHARMWFASIWIFTLGLPWTMGAEFFLRHLLDGDAASNTLSWRWVAGLHTRGKHYIARAANIARYTNGRFNPVGQLRESPSPIRENIDTAIRPLYVPDQIDEELPSGWLILGDDLCVELALDRPPRLVSAAAGWCSNIESDLNLTSTVVDFKRQALMDGLHRVGSAFATDITVLDSDDWFAGVFDWTQQQGLRQLICVEPPVGPWRDALEILRPQLRHNRVRLVLMRRRWDQVLWPHANKGFFGFYKKVKPKLNELLDTCDDDH